MKSRHVIQRSEGEALIEAVCKDHGVRVDYVLSRYRYQPLVEARREIACVLRDMGWSTAQVGALLRRDHSTIVALTAPEEVRATRAQAQKLAGIARAERAEANGRVAA